MVTRVAIALCLLSAAAHAQSVIVGSGATEEIHAKSEVSLPSGGAQIQSGGALTMAGVGATAQAVFVGNVTSGSPITVQSGGTIDLKFARLENLSTLTVNAGGRVIRLHDTVFKDLAGFNPSTNPWIDLSAITGRNDLPFSFNRVSFEDPDAPTPRAKNIKAASGTPILRMLGRSSGTNNRWGVTYEDDASGRVFWHTEGVERNDTPTPTRFDTLEDALKDPGTTSARILTPAAGVPSLAGANVFIDDLIDWGANPSNPGSGTAGPTIKNFSLAPMVGAAVADSDADSDREVKLINCVIARGSVGEAHLDAVTVFPAIGSLNLTNCDGDRVLVGDGTTVSQSGNAFGSSLSTAVTDYFIASSAYDYHLAHPAGAAAIDTAPSGTESTDWEGTLRGTVGRSGMATTWDYGADELVPPAAPTGLTHTANGYNPEGPVYSITWIWSGVPNNTGYKVYRSPHAGESSAGQSAQDVVVLTESAGLTENTPYLRHVHALYTGLEGIPSNDNNPVVYTSVHDPVSADFTTTCTADLTVQVTLTTANFPNFGVGQSKWMVERSANGVNGWVTVQSWTTTTPISNTTPAQGLWYYKVTFQNGDGDPTQASPVRVVDVTGPATTPPVAPTNLDDTPGNNQIVLNWDSNNVEPDFAGYNVYRRYVSGGAATKLNSALVIVPTYTDTLVLNGTPYWYFVRAVNANNDESPNSNEIESSPNGSDGTWPNPPVITQDPRRTKDATPVVSGTAEPYTTIKLKNGSEVIGTFTTLADGTWTLSPSSNLPSNADYILTATASDNASPTPHESDISSPGLAITIDTEAPAAPAKVWVTVYNGCVDVEWDASTSADVAGYRLYRKIGTGGFDLVNADGMILGTKYRDEPTQNGLQYSYYVEAIDNAKDY